MIDRRCRNWSWTINTNEAGNYSYPAVAVAVLMDIRDELQALNRVMLCRNTQRVPKILDKIARNTAKKCTSAKRKAKSSPSPAGGGKR